MFYISKYISNTWHKDHANEVPCILKRCFNVAFNVKRKLGLQSKNNVDNYMVQVSTLKAYR